MYAFRGRHRLDVFSACFMAVDEGGATELAGKLTSLPKCVHIPVLRCTKPTMRLSAVDKTMTRYSWATPLWEIPVSTNISFMFEGVDDAQTSVLRIHHHADHGIPSLGAEWKAPQCTSDSAQRVTCNPVKRELYFGAEMIHAGAQMTICVEAVNDQQECPRYRKNNAAAATQPFAQHFSAAGVLPSPITTSQASEPYCFHIQVNGPDLHFVDPTPAQDVTVVTYIGCPFTLTLAAEDGTNHFNLQIEPWTAEFSLPIGVFISAPTCQQRPGAPPPATVATGVGSCPKVSRTLSWSPSRAQTGLHEKACFHVMTTVGVTSARCFVLHVSKCRYCAQRDESLKTLAASYFTGNS